MKNSNKLLNCEITKKFPTIAVLVNGPKGLYTTNGCITMLPDKYESKIKKEGIYANIKIKKELESYVFISADQITTTALTEADFEKYFDSNDHDISDMVKAFSVSIEVSSYTKIIFDNGEIQYLCIYDGHIYNMCTIPPVAVMISKYGLDAEHIKWFIENIASVYDRNIIDNNFLSVINQETKMFSSVNLLKMINNIPNDRNYVDCELVILLSELILYDKANSMLIRSSVRLNLIFKNVIQVISESGTKYFTVTKTGVYSITSDTIIKVLDEINFDIDISALIRRKIIDYRLVGEFNPYVNICKTVSSVSTDQMWDHYKFNTQGSNLIVCLIPIVSILKRKQDTAYIEDIIKNAILFESEDEKQIKRLIKDYSLEDAAKFNYKAIE